MIQIEHLTLTHRKDLRLLVEDLSLVLNPGDKAALIGEEGNGKSTLLRWLYDPESVAPWAEARGVRRDRGETYGYLPQELPEEERGKTVSEYLARDPSFWEASEPALRGQLRHLGLDPAILSDGRRMGELSGGEQVKVQLLSLLLADPDVLLLDEPSNDVDVDTLELLEELIRAHRGIVVFISHDETLLERTANRVILLEQLRKKSRCRHTVANVGFAQFVTQRREALDRQAQLSAGPRREAAQAQERFRRIQQSVEHAQATVSRQDPSTGRLLKKKMAAVKALEKRYEREREDRIPPPEEESPIGFRFNGQRAMPAGKTVLELALPELRTRDGDRVLARDVSLLVRGPEKVCITGPNGCGKTTLLRHILAELSKKPELRVGYMPQDYGELLPPDRTPAEYLAADDSPEALTDARTCLGAMRFTRAEMNRPLTELSGGQRAKLLLVKLSQSETDVLVLDEPTRNVSPLSGPVIRELLSEYPGAILAVSHDRKFLSQVAERVLELTPAGLREKRFAEE